MGLRDFARLRRDAPLNPFDLARLQIYSLLILTDQGSQQPKPEATAWSASEEWSGGACSRPLPRLPEAVVLNPNHGAARTNATLMEETLPCLSGTQNLTGAVIADEGRGQTMARDYRKLDEEAAYAIGAAALVPFAALRRAILDGKSAADVARHFRVSRDLIEYRLKVTRLWRTYKSAQT